MDSRRRNSDGRGTSAPSRRRGILATRGDKSADFWATPDDDRLRHTLAHLLGTLHDDGGWRCRKFGFGRGPETEFSNPGPTLTALDALRLAGLADSAPGGAVALLLDHWDSRAPLGPCHFGIGTLFLQVGYPFAGYNLFSYLHVLSPFDQARRDPRFLRALAVLESKLVDGRIVANASIAGWPAWTSAARAVPPSWGRRATPRSWRTWAAGEAGTG